ncbi:MAG: FIST C-terminal domain-containing protein [Candidatus Omnitrophica bacterium]|nr:FIST C-terminal domain-containing protein [Candidatus Omnitrophota bacterium]
MPLHVGIGLSTDNDPQKAARECIRQARENLNFTSFNLAVVFSTLDYAHPTVFKTIGSLLENVPILGASSLAIISSQGIFKRGIVILLLAFSEDIHLSTACSQDIRSRPIRETGRQLADRLLSGLKNVPRDFGIFFADGLIPDSSSLLAGIQERLGRSFPLAGALASDNLAFKKTYLYFNGQVLSDSVCGMLWGGKINFGLGIKHGWKPLGKPHSVTKSSANIVYEIDGEPAVKFYEEYLGNEPSRLKSELRHISILYPLGIHLKGEEEYLLRNILFINEDGSLVFQGDVPQGCVVRLMIGTKESCLMAAGKAAGEANRGLKGNPAKFALVFNSVSRNILLGRQSVLELETVKEKLGENTPIIGLYTYGEQAPLKSIGYHGNTYFHNQTITILAAEG